MTNQTEINDKYQAEQAQTKQDHHTPTAGAMTNHILANLVISDFRLYQVKWFIKGPMSGVTRDYLDELINDNHEWFEVISELLLTANELPASTTAEYQEYSMIAENGADKYLNASEMIFGLAKDYDTNNLFIDRAIKLAQTENQLALADQLVRLRQADDEAIYRLQALIGNTPRVGLDEEDDDD